MPAYNFQKQFISKIEKGTKRTTIRATRKHRAQAGQTAYLFFGMRTKHCKRLGEQPIVAVRDITLHANKTATLDGKVITSPYWLKQLANDDGFDVVADLFDYFASAGGLPFTGEHIQWQPITEQSNDIH